MQAPVPNRECDVNAMQVRVEIFGPEWKLCKLCCELFGLYKFVQLFILKLSVHCFRKKKQWSETLVLFNKAICVCESRWSPGFSVCSWHAKKPRKSSLSWIRACCWISSPDFGIRTAGCARVVVWRYPGYSSRVSWFRPRNRGKTKTCWNSEPAPDSACGSNWKEVTQQIRCDLHKLRGFKANALK